MDETVRQSVRLRAGNRCEYCRLPQHIGVSIRFHIEHIVSRQHGGSGELDNLALACPNCNWNKGPNLSAIDPVRNVVVALYNPRTDLWDDHFLIEKAYIVGRTPVGRATVRLLRMNEPHQLEVRRESGFGGQTEGDE